MTTIAILATLDTKALEVSFLAEAIRTSDAQVVLIDIGVLADGGDLVATHTNVEVASLGGTELTELRIDPSRERASEVMVAGATKLVSRLVDSGEVDGVVGLGGTQGTANCSKVLQSLPYGLPKLMVSTMASGDTSEYVGIKDITMMFSVSDILGLNPLLRRILQNAAAAVVGMARVQVEEHGERERRVIGVTNLGVLTEGTMYALDEIEKAGHESIVFHAVGSGGRAMEQLMRSGEIDAVFDYALGDIVDSMFDGLRSADATRLTVAGELGLPQIVVPGGVDHIGVALAEPNVVPDRYRDRVYTYHNPTILVPRTSPEELTAFGEEIGRRLVDSVGNTVVLIPTGGLSSYSAPGGPLVDATADRALVASLHASIPAGIPVLEVDAGAPDEAFVDRALSELFALMDASSASA